MEWFENEELAMISDTISTFSAQEIQGKVVDLERLGKPEFPRDAIDRLSAMGFLWGPAPEDMGSDMDRVTSVTILSGLAFCSAGFASIVATHYAALDALLAIRDGFELLKGVSGGNGERGRLPLLGIALNNDIEPFGHTAEGGRYRAIPTLEKVDGTVFFHDEGPEKKMLIARGSDISRSVTMTNDLSGCDEMPTAEMRLPDDILGGLEVLAEGNNACVAEAAMVSSLKLYYSAVMQGAARSATEYALDYARQRRQTGRAIIYHQNVRKKIVEMEIKNQSMTSFLYRAACNGTADHEFNLKDMLYAFTKSESEYVVNEAMQTLGGYGYMREYGIEKKLRDVKTLQAILPTTLTEWLGLQVV
jgi:alkylation response protein AidB-like acyl-CoA dehydrogenase